MLNHKTKPLGWHRPGPFPGLLPSTPRHGQDQAHPTVPPTRGHLRGWSPATPVPPPHTPQKPDFAKLRELEQTFVTRGRVYYQPLWKIIPCYTAHEESQGVLHRNRKGQHAVRKKKWQDICFPLLPTLTLSHSFPRSSLPWRTQVPAHKAGSNGCSTNTMWLRAKTVTKRNVWPNPETSSNEEIKTTRN